MNGKVSTPFVRLGALLLILSLGVCVAELLAAQVPSSPLHLAVLVGPLTQLREALWWIAIFLFVFATHAEGVFIPRALIWATHAGVVLLIGALTYGASQGMIGVQIIDPRPDAGILFAARTAGQMVLAVCLIDFLRRLLSRGRVSSPREPVAGGQAE